MSLINNNPSPTGGGFFDSILGGVFGRDEFGNIKTVDLSRYVKLPDVTVKADENQSRNLFYILGGSALLLLLFNKNKKYVRRS